MKVYAWRFWHLYKFEVNEDFDFVDLEDTDKYVAFAVVDDNNRVVWGSIKKEIEFRKERIKKANLPLPKPLIYDWGTVEVLGDENARYRESKVWDEMQLAELLEIQFEE